MTKRFRRILSGLLEEIIARLIAVAMLAAWGLALGLALGLAGKCFLLFAPQSLFLVLMGVAALALAVPFLALWRLLQKASS